MQNNPIFEIVSSMAINHCMTCVLFDLTYFAPGHNILKNIFV